MINLPERSRVFVSGLRAEGAAGSGICFTQTTTFMADHLCGTDPYNAIRPGHGAVSAASHSGGGVSQAHEEAFAVPSPKLCTQPFTVLGVIHTTRHEQPRRGPLR